jgi:hypothetical protein
VEEYGNWEREIGTLGGKSGHSFFFAGFIFDYIQSFFPLYFCARVSRVFHLDSVELVIKCLSRCLGGVEVGGVEVVGSKPVEGFCNLFFCSSYVGGIRQSRVIDVG